MHSIQALPTNPLQQLFLHLITLVINYSFITRRQAGGDVNRCGKKKKKSIHGGARQDEKPSTVGLPWHPPAEGGSDSPSSLLAWLLFD